MTRLAISAYDLPPEEFLALATCAEAAGISRLWIGEHLFWPANYASVHPTGRGHPTEEKQEHAKPVVGPETHLNDTFTLLGALAATTSTLELATGIYIAPLRHPLLTVRGALTVAEISKGRFSLGLGAGWLEEEFAALNAPYSQRGKALDETIAVLRAAASGEPFAHAGEVYSFDAVSFESPNYQLPILTGGNTPRAIRRAANLADGWANSASITLDVAIELRDELTAARRQAGTLDRAFEFSVRPESADLDEVSSFVDAGFENVIVWAHHFWPAHGVSNLDDACAEATEAMRALVEGVS